MIMESGLHDLHGMIDALRYDEFFSDQGILGALGPEETQHFPLHRNCAVFLQPSPEIISGAGSPAASAVSVRAEGDSTEDSEIFSDIALSYISRMLMEEDIDEKVNTYQKEAALRAAEKPFYDILGQKYPPSPDRAVSGGANQQGNLRNARNCCSGVVDSVSVSDLSDQQRSLVCGTPKSDYPSPCSFSSSSSVTNVGEPFDDSVANAARPPAALCLEGLPAWHFERGVEEARKFLPSNDKLVIDLEANCEGTSIKSSGGDVEERDVGSRVRKNPNSEELDLVEGRSNKQSAVSTELEGARCEWLDMVLLYQGDTRWKRMYDLHESSMPSNEASKINPKSDQVMTKGLNASKGARGKRQTKKGVVDLRTILIHCAQAVAVDDRRTANELLKQIRQHTSSSGDGSQRLAHWFADGLEARLAGTGTQIYRTLVAKRTTASDILKAYHLYLAACPFKKISHFFSNQTILNISAKASRVHIIDFGIYFGFQWPYLIQRLSTREGGPPNLRITGIDVPQPGFRPTERIEETGRRLEDYAKCFHVPFEYQAIASKWETIRAEDLNIREGEVVIVNCLYRFRNLVDETVIVDSPRNKVLNAIRKMNPDVFVHGIVNGSYGAPFFVTRFREALFHYSALFDMLEATVPRENEQRLLIERDLFGREALNVIACEGSERVERPETYKQWQVRNLKAGFSQLPLDGGIMKKAKEKVRASYHKDFVIDVDGRWLLQGWKGRIIYAISTWRPNSASTV